MPSSQVTFYITWDRLTCQMAAQGKCCSGRAPTAARGTVGHVWVPLTAATCKFCSGRAPTGVQNKSASFLAASSSAQKVIPLTFDIFAEAAGFLKYPISVASFGLMEGLAKNLGIQKSVSFLHLHRSIPQRDVRSSRPSGYAAVYFTVDDD